MRGMVDPSRKRHSQQERAARPKDTEHFRNQQFWLNSVFQDFGAQNAIPTVVWKWDIYAIEQHNVGVVPHAERYGLSYIKPLIVDFMRKKRAKRHLAAADV